MVTLVFFHSNKPSKWVGHEQYYDRIFVSRNLDHLGITEVFFQAQLFLQISHTYVLSLNWANVSEFKQLVLLLWGCGHWCQGSSLIFSGEASHVVLRLSASANYLKLVDRSSRQESSATGNWSKPCSASMASGSIGVRGRSIILTAQKFFDTFIIISIVSSVVPIFSCVLTNTFLAK